VLKNLHAMSRNIDRLPRTNGTAASQLHEALGIRLTILKDNLQGFVTAADIDRRDKYKAVEELLADMGESVAALPTETAGPVNATLESLHTLLGKLTTGAKGVERKSAEQELASSLRLLQNELRGEEEPPPDYCGSCYGAEMDPKRCCNTCADVRRAYRIRKWGFPPVDTVEQCRREMRSKKGKLVEGEGCNIFGTMELARVTGSFTIAPSSTATAGRDPSAMLLAPMQVSLSELGHFNVTHQVKRLSFGADFPGQHNPLDNTWIHSPTGPAVAKYFLKVVPTTYQFLNKRTYFSNQFSVTQYFKALDSTSKMTPTIAFTFELTPLKVSKKEQRGGSLLGFFTRCFAVIGGLFTVAGIIDSLFYATSKQIKIQLNKQG